MSIFDEIRQQTGINVSITERFFPYRATFDIESYIKKVQSSIHQKLSIESEHELMSIAVSSNIPTFTDPVCFISDGDTDKLVEDFVLYLHKLSEKAAELMLVKHTSLIDQLIHFKETRQVVENQFKDKKLSSPFHYNSRSIKRLIERFYDYLSELPVIGFNSQKYDLNVMRAPLIKYLLKHNKINFTIKRDNSLKCLKTNKLKFLDILNYIAPGFDYGAFIKAYGCEMTKGFFPYEYISSLAQLAETQLPPHAAFFSTLKQANISEDEYKYCQ